MIGGLGGSTTIGGPTIGGLTGGQAIRRPNDRRLDRRQYGWNYWRYDSRQNCNGAKTLYLRHHNCFVRVNQAATRREIWPDGRHITRSRTSRHRVAVPRSDVPCRGLHDIPDLSRGQTGASLLDQSCDSGELRSCC